MFPSRLPSYTTERFYLISEIEQVASFIFLDQARSQQFANNSNFSLYMLWNQSNGIDELKKTIQEMKEGMKQRQMIAKNTLVVVEVFNKNLSPDPDMAAKDKILIEAFEYTQQCFEGAYILFGLASDECGSCGLEAILDFCIAFEIGQSVVIGIGREKFLGHSESENPTAKSDIIQHYVASQKLSLKEWTLMLGSKNAPKSASEVVKRPSSAFPWFFFIAFVAILVALFKFYFKKI